MESQSNAETLRRVYARWSASKGTDLSMWDDYATDDLRIRSLGEGQDGILFSAARKGRTQLRAYLEDLTQAYALEHWTLKETVSDGDGVIALADTGWTHRDSGKTFEAAVAIICRFRDGKVYDYQEFYDTDAFAAVPA